MINSCKIRHIYVAFLAAKGLGPVFFQLTSAELGATKVWWPGFHVQLVFSVVTNNWIRYLSAVKVNAVTILLPLETRKVAIARSDTVILCYESSDAPYSTDNRGLVLKI